MEQTTINGRIFIGIEIGMWEGKVMATGSKRGSSADATLRWKKVMQARGFCWICDQTNVCQHKYQVVNVEDCVTQAVFESFTEDGINPGFVILRQLTSIGWQCIVNNRLNY